MARIIYMGRRKPTNKQRSNRSPKPGGSKTPPRSLMRVLHDAVNIVITVVIGAAEEIFERSKTVWQRLTQWQRMAIACIYAAAILPPTLYCGWITLMRGQYIVIVRLGSIAIYSGFAVSMLMMASAIFFAFLNACLPVSGPQQNSATRQRKRLPARYVGLLPRARWRYLRGQYAQAQVMLDALLAREPGNAAAIELQNLIVRHQKQAKPQTAEIHAAALPSRAEELLDSKLPTMAPRILVTLMLGLVLWGCAVYIRVGLTQGWQTTVWSGIARDGQAIRESALNAIVWLIIAGAICLLYLIVDLGGIPEPLKRVFANFAARIRQQTARLPILRRRKM